MSLTFGGSGSSFQSTDGDLRTNYPIVSNGQLLASTFASYDVLPPGTNGQLLSRNTSSDLGLQWITPSGVGEVNTASNVGTDRQVFKQKVGADLQFRTIKEGTGITVTQNANDLTIASTVQSGLIYSGTWDALNNTPPLASGIGDPGSYYIVSVGGDTVNLDGITDWKSGDWVIFNDDGNVWQKNR